MDRHFLRRGILFLNGKPLEQVMNPVDLASRDSGAFWVEHNGMRIHVRFPDNSQPGDFLVEATAKEQVFVPLEYGLGYIALKGITFQHAGNGFPVPQRGLVSTNRGHHWLVENCTIEWANSLGIDMGNEMWSTVHQPGVGFHIVRNNVIKNCGIGGLEALGAKQMLIEDNLFEHIGWQNAELAFESGAIKIHTTVNTMIRRNIFRYISFAPGIWLDYLANENCRITKNVFADITTARGAIYIEVSRHDCLVDHNIFL
ncbi:MAG: right-handed parallel beta-helix repeat-containing protein [Bacteroidales bacterium]|nr:right-handed parallel beta-helix repeat-containing protein [Bacteroidales bacterium]